MGIKSHLHHALHYVKETLNGLGADVNLPNDSISTSKTRISTDQHPRQGASTNPIWKNHSNAPHSSGPHASLDARQLSRIVTIRKNHPRTDFCRVTKLRASLLTPKYAYN